MGSSHRKPPNRRPWIVLGVLLCVAVVAVIAVLTKGFGMFGDASSTERVAQDRCQTEVRDQLASPSTTTLSDLKAETSTLDPDSKDLFKLTLDGPLKGVDHSRITVWNVSGVAQEEKTAYGDAIHDRFDCRAYFVDGNLVDALVLFDRDH
jgi:hypothetical protein